MNTLARHMQADLSGPRPPGLDALVEPLRRRFGDALLGVVLYGSCLRRQRLDEGLVDLMAVVRGYRAAHAGRLAALANFILPPNVYYLQTGAGDDGPLRCKYIVVSRATLKRRCAGGLDGYFWARFTQPCRLAWSGDEDFGPWMARRRAAAARHFARQALGPASAPEPLDALGFWSHALAATYACELRPEPPGAAAGLVDADPAFWQRITPEALDGLPGVRSAGPGRWHIESSAPVRVVRRGRWLLRAAWSKALNLARLFKAAGTFSNGLDYLLWKIERHSGVRVEATEAMRRKPRRSALRLTWRLWRQGAFR